MNESQMTNKPLAGEQKCEEDSSAFSGAESGLEIMNSISGFEGQSDISPKRAPFCLHVIPFASRDQSNSSSSLQSNKSPENIVVNKINLGTLNSPPGMGEISSSSCHGVGVTKDKQNTDMNANSVLAKHLLIKKIMTIKDRVEIDDEFNEKQNEKMNIINMFKTEVRSLNQKQRYERAAMFFREAVFSRKMRYLFSSEFIKSVYNIHGNPIWSDILCFMSWCYLILTFFEPSHSSDRPFSPTSWNFYTLMAIEILFLLLFLTDETLDFILRYTDLERTKTQHFLKNKKFVIHLIVDIILIVDIFGFYISYSQELDYFRFGRMARPFKLIFYSGESRRWLKSVLNSWKNLLDILILFTITILMFALLAIRLLGDSDAYIEDEISNENNMTNFGSASLTLYMLTTLSNYPAAIIPYCKVSNYYFFFFLPYLYIILLFFVPIPVAVVYEQFNKERTKLLMDDRLREKEALFAVHICVDFEEKGSITKEQWNKLCIAIYRGNSHEETTDMIFSQFDINGDEDLDIYEFFDACELIICLKDIQTAFACDPSCWNSFRVFCNTKLKLRAIVTSRPFDIFIMFIIFVNITVLIVGEIAGEGSETADICDQIDFYILFIYTLEIILKIIGLGVINYFSDPWNKLDFALVLISFIIQSTISFLKLLRYPKGLKALKASNNARKTSRGFKAAKTVKGIKAGRCIHVVLGPFRRIKTMIVKIYRNISTINNMVALMILIFYFYGVIGVEIYHPNIKGSIHSEFESSIYAEFNNIGAAMIGLFQITTQSSWHAVVLHYAENYNFTGALFYFMTFHMIVVLILLNLTSGLIWEVFTIVNEQSVDTEEDSVESDDIRDNQQGGKESFALDNNNNEIIPNEHKNESRKELYTINEDEEKDSKQSLSSPPSSFSSDKSSLNSEPGLDTPDPEPASNPSEGKNLQKIAKNIDGISSKLYLRTALLRGSDVNKLKAQERKAIRDKFAGQMMANRFDNARSIIENFDAKVFQKKFDKICMRLFRSLREADRPKQVIRYINNALLSTSKLLNNCLFLMINEIEIKDEDEEGIVVKLCTPFVTTKNTNITDLSELFEDIAQNNSENKLSYTLKNIFQRKMTPKPISFSFLSTVGKPDEEVIRKQDLAEKLTDAGHRFGINMKDINLKDNKNYDIQVETIKVTDDAVKYNFFEEETKVGSTLNSHVETNIQTRGTNYQPDDKTVKKERLPNIILKKIYITCLVTREITEKRPLSSILVHMIQTENAIRDLRDMIKTAIENISEFLTEFYAKYEGTKIFDTISSLNSKIENNGDTSPMPERKRERSRGTFSFGHHLSFSNSSSASK